MASIRKRTLASGKIVWQCDYTDNLGKRRHKQFQTKKEADAFLVKARSEVAAGIHTADSATITLAQAGKLWLASGDAAGLERTTMDQRRQHLSLHIVPLAGDTKLSKLTVPWVRSFQDALRERGRSPAMIKRLTVSLGSIIADAQARGLVAHNPVRELSRARSGTNAGEKRAKAKIRVGVDIPHNYEIKAIIDAATGRYRPLLVTMIFTGVRASEARGLKWEDIDLQKGVIHVRRRADCGFRAEAGRHSDQLPATVPI
jgi:integrase